MFSVAFKNVVGALRASWRVLDSVRAGSDPDEAKCADGAQAELEAELRDTCRELLGLVDRSSEEMEGKVFFAKMAGDYNRCVSACVAAVGVWGARIVTLVVSQVHGGDPSRQGFR